MLFLFLYNTTIIASPIADSAATTVKIKKTNICPVRSFKRFPNTIKLKFIDRNISSNDINIIIIFFLLRNIPASEILNKTELNIR